MIRCRYSHWLPLFTRCPANGLPDLGYVTFTTRGFIDVLRLRALVATYTGRKIFAEDIVEGLVKEVRGIHPGQVTSIRYRRLFGRLECTYDGL